MWTTKVPRGNSKPTRYKAHPPKRVDYSTPLVALCKSCIPLELVCETLNLLVRSLYFLSFLLVFCCGVIDISSRINILHHCRRGEAAKAVGLEY